MGSTPPLFRMPRPPDVDGNSNLAPSSRRRPHASTDNPAPGCSRPASEPAEPPAKIRRTSHEDDGMKCPICLEPYGTAGDHRLVALKCGHLFGSRCVERWLRNQTPLSRCCPTCRTHASLQDMRNIYTDRVITIDDSVLVAIQSQVEQLEAERNSLQRELETFRNWRTSTPCSEASPSHSFEPISPPVFNFSSRQRRRNRRGSRRRRILTPSRLHPQPISPGVTIPATRDSAFLRSLPAPLTPEAISTPTNSRARRQRSRRRRLGVRENRHLAQQTTIPSSAETAPTPRPVARPRRRLPR